MNKITACALGSVLMLSFSNIEISYAKHGGGPSGGGRSDHGQTMRSPERKSAVHKHQGKKKGALKGKKTGQKRIVKRGATPAIPAVPPESRR